MDSPAVLAPASKQYGCVNCTDRKFYIMLQPSGDIEVFCCLNNHRQLLVNIPKLIEAAFDSSFDSIEKDGNESNDTGDPSFSG